jgi:uncharacterized protein YjbI with pentapeptide repeats
VFDQVSGDLRGRDLRGRDLRGRDLRGRDLRGRDLRRRRGCLIKVHLRKASSGLFQQGIKSDEGLGCRVCG